MTTAIAAASSRAAPRPSGLLFAGILLATLTEAVAGTVLSLARADILGDTHATPDEFAWLDVGYVGMKFAGFLVAPWLLSRVAPRGVVACATLVMGAACAAAAATAQLDTLVALRAVQGLSGGILLVGGQAMVFLAYPRPRQPLLQALFATGAVVVPATIAPAFQGWLIDFHAWTWIFLGVVPVALMSAGCMLVADVPRSARPTCRRFDWVGFTLIGAALFCFTYVLGQGSRWDWFAEPRIRWLTAAGAAGLLAFCARQGLARPHGLVDVSVFRSSDFSFAFAVSFVAGAALFGSAYLIPAFALSVLAFTPTAAGLLLLPSGAVFVGALLVAAFLMRRLRTPPIATVPVGILLVMAAMWLLSGSTGESGADDMMAAVLLRGVGLGFLFLSITLTAFGNLGGRNLAFGIGLFNTGRQLGGLLGVAGLQTLIDHDAAANAAVFGASIAPGVSAVGERQAAITDLLVAGGMDVASASRVATSLLRNVVVTQSVVIAFDTAFMAVAMLFVIAAPILVAVKVGLGRAARSPRN